LEFDQAYVDDLAAALRIAERKKARLTAEYGLNAYDSSILSADRETVDFFEAAARFNGAKRDAKAVATG